MKIDVSASQPHYLDHMLPIFEVLPERLKGTIHALETPCRQPYRGRIAMVAGWVDVQRLRNMSPMIYVEHGAGQAYLGDPKTATLPGYSGGGSRHSGITGYVCPSDMGAERWRPAPAGAAGRPASRCPLGLLRLALGRRAELAVARDAVSVGALPRVTPGHCRSLDA